MATVFNPNTQNDEENQQQQGQPQSGATQPISVGSGQGSQIQAGAPAAQSAPTGQPKGSAAGSGRFLNIQKYINANQGVDYAGKIGQNLQNQNQQFQSNLNQAQQGVESQANPELQRLQAGSGLIQQAGQTPEQIAQDQTKADAFTQLRTGQHGQVGLNNEAELESQRQKVQQNADLAGNESGRYQLLRNTFATPSYSRGQNKLDQLLLQGQSGQLRDLGQTTQNAAKQASTGLENLRGSVTNYNQQIQSGSQQAQQQAQEAVNQRITQDQQAIQERVAQAQAEREGRFNQFNQGLSSGQLSQADAERLGLSGGQKLMGLDLTRYTNPGAVGKVGIGNIANAQDQARFDALARLSGQNELSEYATPGEQLSDVAQFNKDQFLSDLAAQKYQYDTEAAPINQNLARPTTETVGNTTIKHKQGYYDQQRQLLEALNKKYQMNRSLGIV